jgi:hypothetical protein
MSQTKAQLVSGTTTQDLTVDNINTSSINSGQASGRKNLIINGAMNIAQRTTSGSTTEGYAVIDRFATLRSGNDEGPTASQADVASGTTPYSLGFRKSFKVTNGNQTSGAGTTSTSAIVTRLEAQDMATSGWNYTSSSSYITLSFWVKASVSQNYYFSVFTQDGTSFQYTMETGVLTADTWTKITKTIPGNSNLQFDTDTEANRIARGFDVQWVMFRGTDSTGTRPLNAWAAVDSATRSPDMTSTWYTTNDSTFEITGVQLEVGSTATDFEHMSFDEDLALCQRYCYVTPYGGNSTSTAGNEETVQCSASYAATDNDARFLITFPRPMRVTPSYTGSNTVAKVRSKNTSANFNLSTGPSSFQMKTAYNIRSMNFSVGGLVSYGNSSSGTIEFNEAGGFMKFESEL